MGRNNADFQGVTFKYSNKEIPNGAPVTRPEGGFHCITAHKGEDRVGILVLKKTGEIHNIDVEDAHQMQGIATGMWRHAQSLHRSGVIPVEPKHSPKTTDAGYGFAMSTGDPVPPRSDEMLRDGRHSSEDGWMGRS